MYRTLLLAASVLTVVTTLGCESAVLVNTRPDSNSPADTAQPASYRESDNTSVNDNAPTTQPAAQSVNTKHTSVELQNDAR